MQKLPKKASGLTVQDGCVIWLHRIISSQMGYEF